MYYVYFLQSKKDKKLYIGYTTNLQKRLQYHNNGLNKSTRNRRPLKLVYYESYQTKKEATKQEYYYKHINKDKNLKFKLIADFLKEKLAGVV